VSRVLSGNARRRSKLFDDLCKYIFSIERHQSGAGTLHSQDLTDAVAMVWDGTPQHARALDELASGYLGRLLILNGLPVTTAAKRYLAGLVATKGPIATADSWTAQLAAMAGQSVEAFRYQHTLLPFYGAVLATGVRSWLDPNERATEFRHSAHQFNSQGAFLCPECVGEDMSFWGVSYWRRSHQLPGVIWCDKPSAGC
jgi:hypothetical protein